MAYTPLGTFAQDIAMIASGAYATGSTIIANGQTVGGVISMPALGRLSGIQIPAAFTGTAISFQVSMDNVTFGTFKQGGAAVSITVAVSDCVDVLGAYPGLTAWPYVKVVSNAAEGGARTLNYVLV